MGEDPQKRTGQAVPCQVKSPVDARDATDIVSGYSREHYLAVDIVAGAPTSAGRPVVGVKYPTWSRTRIRMPSTMR
jgi:hypothetical protein